MRTGSLLVKSLVEKIVNRFIFQIPENLRVLKAIHKISKLETPKIEYGHDVVVFSKDRPLQLKALIESYQYYCEDPVKLNIIYNASDHDYQNAYDSLFDELKEFISLTVKDNIGFRNSLLNVFEALYQPKMYFLVDDLIFKKRFCTKDFLKFDRSYIPSLRMGTHLKKSYTQQKNQSLPILDKINKSQYSWFYSKSELDWAYPLSVDGHIFFRDEIEIMVNALDFKAPNSFEAKLQKFNRLYKKKIGVCEEVSIILNIPCNKVQVENENISGDFHQRDLLQHFYLKKIDIKSYDCFKNESCHQDVELKLLDIESCKK